jgi:RNA polymerase subunit RPABC4/transcription elongation factor Spt4
MVVRKKKVNKIVSHSKCKECGNVVDGSSKFCKFCGANLVPAKKVRSHKCPTCNGVVEEFSRFCKHCGSNIDTILHSRFVRILLYFILFLILVLALLLLFSPTLVNFNSVIEKNVDDGLVYEVSEPFLKVNNAVCSWQDDSFNLCANVNWDGKNAKDYVKCSFGGEMDAKKWMTSPFTCCLDVGNKEGIKLVRAFLNNDEGENYLDDGVSVNCDGKPNVKPVEVGNKYTIYQKSFWFVAQTRGGISYYGDGTQYIEFPGRVKECEINGRWVTKDDPTTSGGDSFCDGAEGIFFGDADQYGQSVFSDPGKFWWTGIRKTEFDPEGDTHSGYGVYLHLCDRDYLNNPEHYVRGRLNGFGSNELALDWEYYSSHPKPKASVFVDLNCKVY